MTMGKKPHLQTGLTLLLLLALTVPLQGQTKLKPGFNLFSLQQDVEIGAKSAEEIEKQMPVLRNQRVQNYIAEVGERLAKATDGPDFPYQFKVVNVSDVNAFALPGGFMFVHRGLIEAADNEAEVAGVMAHEISHVALRHGTNQASKAYLAQAGLGILGAILGGGGGTTTQMINMIGGFGLNATFLKFGRDAEKQSDLMGTQILARAGYDPMAMSTFFDKLRELQGKDPSKMEIFFSSHPAPADRAQYVADEVRLLKLQPRGSTGNFESIKADMEKMPKAPSMKDLASNGGDGQPPRETESPETTVPQLEPPSRSLATFEAKSGLYSVRYPDNW
ncbi:MAG: M48 family metalloprotease, partial [Acidobacteriota bacterium]